MVSPVNTVGRMIRDAGPRTVIPVCSLMMLIAAQIAYPLTGGSARDAVTVLVVALSAGTALVHAALTRGLRYAAGFAVLVSGIGLAAEAVGTATGIPFGNYDYAVGRLGPALFEVPLVVPLAWTGGLYPIWVVAGMLAGTPVKRIVVTAAAAVGWDLFLDPQMVADRQWHWHDSDSGLPGIEIIPWTNYLGWFVVVGIIATALTAWERTAPPGGAVGVPILMLLWTWLGSALAHAVFLGLPASACYGGVALGALGVPLLVRLVRHGTAGPDVPVCGPAGPVAWRR